SNHKQAPMNGSGDQEIVPGILLSATGSATIEPFLADVLFDLALKLEEETNLPVDVQHVLAAIVLASRQGEIDPDTSLSADDAELTQKLIRHVQAVFVDHGGKVGMDD